MHFRIRTAKHVWLSTLLTSSISVVVPLTVVVLAIGWHRIMYLPGILAITGLIPLFIAFPISLFAFNIVKTVNQTVEALDGLVKYDAMTGLIGRVHFLRLVEEKRRHGGYLAIVDADHFKAINDTHGHEAGDIALKYLADEMMLAVGSHGIVGRMGGEEFGVYLPALALPQLKLVLAALGSQLRAKGFVYNSVQIRPTVSVGVVADRGTEPTPGLFRKADRCLYIAKAKGRDRIVIEEELDGVVSCAA